MLGKFVYVDSLDIIWFILLPAIFLGIGQVCRLLNLISSY